MKTCSLEAIILDLDTSDYNSSPCLAVLCGFCSCFSVCFLLLLFLVLKIPAFLSSVHSYQPFYMFAVLLAYASILI